jgi:hypothetical protein
MSMILAEELDADFSQIEVTVKSSSRQRRAKNASRLYG